MKIEFSPHARFFEDRESVLVNANVDGKTVLCVVPQEYLTAPHVQKLDEQTALRLFQESRGLIESDLRARIERRAFEADGAVILRPGGI
jgi:hypothetical protein